MKSNPSKNTIIEMHRYAPKESDAYASNAANEQLYSM